MKVCKVFQEAGTVLDRANNNFESDNKLMDFRSGSKEGTWNVGWGSARKRVRKIPLTSLYVLRHIALLRSRKLKSHSSTPLVLSKPPDVANDLSAETESRNLGMFLEPKFPSPFSRPAPPTESPSARAPCLVDKTSKSDCSRGCELAHPKPGLLRIRSTLPSPSLRPAPSIRSPSVRAPCFPATRTAWSPIAPPIAPS